MGDKVQPPNTGNHDSAARFLDFGDGTYGLVLVSRAYVWNPVALAWEKEVQATGGAGSPVDPVGLKNVAQNAVNPATEDTLATLLRETIFTGRLGEVQANPTANTVLDRLKALATLLAGGLPAALTAGGGLKTGLVDALPVGTNNIGDVDVVSLVYPTPLTTPATGVVTVATAGSRQQMPNLACKAVSVKAHKANTGLIYLGGSGVTAADGYRLSPGEPLDLGVDNANRLYIDAAVNGEGVSYLTLN